MSDAPVIIAHRGASARSPENTLTAVRTAVALGADLVEVDVQRTRDGALVLMHDATVARTTDVHRVLPHRSPWWVEDLTLAELRRLDAGSWWDPRYAGEPVPTLDEAAAALPAPVGLQLELKLPAHHPGIVESLAGALLAAGGPLRTLLDERRVVVQSFDVLAMKELKTRVPSLSVGLLGRPAKENLPALATWADQVNPSHLRVDSRYVAAVHDAGMRCMVWTVDGALATRRVLRMRVDGVITNRPEALTRVRRTPAGVV